MKEIEAINKFIAPLPQVCHGLAKEKGFWDKPRSTAEVFMLIVSELGEALEAHRKGYFARLETLVGETDDVSFSNFFVSNVKDTFEDELADTAIRIFDYMGKDGMAAEIHEAEYAYYAEVGLRAQDGLFFTVEHLVSAYHNNRFSTGRHYLSKALAILFVIANKAGANLIAHIEMKLRYNKTRPRLHGKQY